MSPLFPFVLGLLIGWLIDGLIDYFYWRRYAETREVNPRESISESRAALVAAVEPSAPVNA